MNIAIIGAGNVGRALAGSSVRAGHTVTISSSDRQDAQAVARATGARAAESNGAAVESAEVVILAVPYPAVAGLLDELGDALSGRIVVDVTNRPTPDLSGTATDGSSAAESIQARLPGARVVKAFNTAFASRMADPIVDGMQVDGFVAGDDEQAKAAVLELAGSIGFRPIDAGSLAFARTLEALAWLNISLNRKNGWAWQDGWKLVGPTTMAA